MSPWEIKRPSHIVESYLKHIDKGIPERDKVKQICMGDSMEVSMITEIDVNEVVVESGGRRAHCANFTQGSNADYIIDNHIVELKILNSETLLKNIDKIFRYIKQDAIEKNNFLCWDHLKKEIFLDYYQPSLKTKRIIDKIMKKRIEGLIKKSSSQIKSTRSIIGIDMPGAVWIVNNNDYWIKNIKSSDIIANFSANATKSISKIIITNSIFEVGS